MFEDAIFDYVPECEVCGTSHDAEIHEATVSVHRWFHSQVTRYLFDTEVTVDQVA
jgi:hypothetical protein